MLRRADVFIELSLIALRKLPRFLGNRDLAAYLADDFCQSAVERQLEIAGDALAQLRRHFPLVFASIPYGSLVIDFRNVLAHGYASLDSRKVFEAATEEAPTLTTVLEALLAQMPER